MPSKLFGPAIALPRTRFALVSASGFNPRGGAANTQHGSNVNMENPFESPERGAAIAALACVSGAAQRFCNAALPGFYAARAAVHRPEQPSMSTRQDPEPLLAPSRPEALAVAMLCWTFSATAPS